MTYTTTKKWLINNVIDGNIAYIINKDIKNDIKSYTLFLPSNVTTKQRIWHIMKEITDLPTCKSCFNLVKFDRKKFKYNTYCSSKCANNCKIVRTKIKNTCIDRYGGPSPSHGKDIKTKTKETILEKYNGKHFNYDKEIQKRKKKTNLNKYGVDHHLKSDEIKDKIKETNLEKYGVDHHLKSDIIKDKIKETNLERYGVENVFKSDIIKDKIKETNLKRYGVENCQQNILVQNKTAKTKKLKYGYEYYNGNYNHKNYKLPSGKIIKIQGYENFALDYLLNKYKEEDLIINGHNIVKYLNINFEYIDFNNKNRKYFPDIFIISENIMIEVKSPWTYNKNNTISDSMNINILKKESVIKNNIKFFFYIFERNASLEII